MFSNLLIIALILALLYLYYQNRQWKKPGPAKEQLTQAQTRWLQEKRALEARIYQHDRDIVQARRYFWQLRLLINEWNVFKGMREIKELIERMRNNPMLEERIE